MQVAVLTYLPSERNLGGNGQPVLLAKTDMETTTQLC